MKDIIYAFRQRLYAGLTKYFIFWASFSLRRWQPRIIVVTGSVGKTMLLHILSAQFGDQAHYSFGANAEVGIAVDIVGQTGVTQSRLHWLKLLFAVPLKALYFTRRQPYYIVEIDLAYPHVAQRLASWLKPERLLWLSNSRVHSANFEKLAARSSKSVDQLTTEELLELASHSQLIYIDADQAEMAKTLKDFQSKLRPVKHDLLQYTVTASSSSFVFKEARFSFSSPQPKALARQLAYCQQLCADLELPLKADLRQLDLPPGRSSYFLGKQGYGMIDSSYNAQTESLRAILDMFQVIEAKHKWLVIGDMTEQGSYGQAAHEDLAGYLCKLDFDKLVLVGRRGRSYMLPIIKAKLPKKVVSFLKPAPALDYLNKHLSAQDLVLFKGSLFLEGIIEALLKDQSQAINLCRRNRLARRWRNKWGLP